MSECVAERYVTERHRFSRRWVVTACLHTDRQYLPQVENQAEQLLARELTYHVKVLWNGDNELGISIHRLIGVQYRRKGTCQKRRIGRVNSLEFSRHCTAANGHLGPRLPGHLGWVESFDISLFYNCRQSTEFLSAF